MTFAVVILAGGEGSRIGGAKPLQRLGGKRLIDRAVTRARDWTETVAIAVRDPVQVGETGVRHIVDAVDIEGPLGGLSAALEFAAGKSCEAVLTIAADMPFLPDDLPARLQATLDGECAALAASAGHLHPVCGLWRTRAQGQLPAYVESGQRSLVGFAKAVGFITAHWTAVPFDPFFNVNTPEELARAERMLRG